MTKYQQYGHINRMSDMNCECLQKTKSVTDSQLRKNCQINHLELSMAVFVQCHFGVFLL